MSAPESELSCCAYSMAEWTREPTPYEAIFGLELPYRPPSNLIAAFVWRCRLWLEVTFALSMLQPWEKLLTSWVLRGHSSHSGTDIVLRVCSYIFLYSVLPCIDNVHDIFSGKCNCCAISAGILHVSTRSSGNQNLTYCPFARSVWWIFEPNVLLSNL